ncbi:MAG: hypothetical protein LBH70_07990 [Spirochaetaceae bacterium]|nr:hypothetical protein [Spirochaetaceae bacterium]
MGFWRIEGNKIVLELVEGDDTGVENQSIIGEYDFRFLDKNTLKIKGDAFIRFNYAEYRKNGYKF